MAFQTLLLGSLPTAIVMAALGWQALPGEDKVLTITTSPSANRAIRPQQGDDAGLQRIHRSPDGLFRVNVLMDGNVVDMIVDTGATRTIMSADQLANRTDTCCQGAPAGTARTLSGQTSYHVAKVNRLHVGTTQLNDFEIAIVKTDRSIAVLGQDVLSQLGPVLLDGDWLTLP